MKGEKEKDLVCIENKVFLTYVILAGLGIGYIVVDILFALLGIK